VHELVIIETGHIDARFKHVDDEMCIYVTVTKTEQCIMCWQLLVWYRDNYSYKEVIKSGNGMCLWPCFKQF